MSIATASPFTIEMADKVLPLVEQIVRDLVESMQEIQEKSQEARKASESESPASAKKIEELKNEVANVERRSSELVIELMNLSDKLHLSLKLQIYGEKVCVDFPIRMNGRPAYACWSLGEPRIGWWHPPATKDNTDPCSPRIRLPA
ncbi:MAG: DUF2203 family protein [bacterium]|nr:DUF2203 family protein [bacterium]